MKLAVSFVLAAASCFGQDAARMDQIVQSYAANQKFTGAALVARGGSVLFSKGYGYANLEWNIANTPDTKFRLGSLTKQFTAASILLLEERSKLSVDDPVKKHLPDAPAAWDKITIRNLLTHTSGIPNFTSFPDYPKLEPFPTTAAELVARFRDKPLDFQPGEKYSYSNSGFVLLGYIIEKITGGSYEKFVTENLFQPLGMKDTGYDSNTRIIPRRADGYAVSPNGYLHAGFIDMSVPHAAGALYSTTEDLLKWEQGLFGKLLQPVSLQKMTTPFLSAYAFGLMVETSAGRKRISHGGGIEGFNTELEYFPEDKLTVVVLENSAGAAPPQDIAGKLAAIAHGEPVTLTGERKEITLSRDALRRRVGVYQMPNGGPVMLFTLDGGQLMSKLGNQQAVAIYPESESRFFLKVVDAQLDFADGQVTLHQNGRDVTAKKLDEATAKRLADVAAPTAQRIKDQKAAPGSEAALRKMIGGLASGKPDYDGMTPAFADVNRQQLPQLQSLISGLGAVQTVTFKGVGPAGPDIYEVKFEKGAQEWRISLSPEGKVDGAVFRPAQ